MALLKVFQDLNFFIILGSLMSWKMRKEWDRNHIQAGWSFTDGKNNEIKPKRFYNNLVFFS